MYHSIYPTGKYNQISNVYPRLGYTVFNLKSGLKLRGISKNITPGQLLDGLRGLYGISSDLVVNLYILPTMDGIEYKGVTYTPEQIATMRDWAKDCQWNDLDNEEIDELSPLTIIRGINMHYCGGLSQFLEDSIPVLVSGGNYSNP